jgi:DNA repair photolyase
MQTIPAKTIVTKTKTPDWFGADYNMNIYRGCCHGCIYCDSRSDCYRIEDFDTVKAKEDALRIIRDDLRRKVKKGVVMTGAMSDPYNPFEAKEKLTRNALELINAYGFGIGIATKSPRLLRDIDILQDIKTHSPVIMKITITTADDALSKIIEPHAPVSSERFRTLKTLADNGIFCGVLLMPVLPFITDTKENILEIISRAKESGARFIYPGLGVTLRANQKAYYYEQLDALFPGLKEKYQKRFGDRYHCAPPKVKELWELFKTECDRVGLYYQMKDIVWAYKAGYEYTQLSLF